VAEEAVPEGIGAGHRYWPLVLEFNYRPLSYLHDSWYHDLEYAELIRTLAGQRLARPALSRHLTQVLGVSAEPWLDFSWPMSRFALLPTPVLNRFCLALGLCHFADAICRVVVAEHVSRLRGQLGEEDYQFALHRAPFLGADPERQARQLPSDGLVEGVAHEGMRQLLDRMAPLPQSLAQRLRLKLPRQVRLEAGDGAAQGDRAAPLPVFLHNILKEVIPEWQPLFN
jgi:hypothetical protein